MAYGLLLPQLTIYLAILCAKFHTIHAQDFLQIAHAYRDRPPIVQTSQAPVYSPMSENYMNPAVPQGVPEYIRIAESIRNGQYAAIHTNPPTHYRPTQPPVNPLQPQTPRTTTYGPIISAMVTRRPTSTTISYDADDQNEAEEDNDKIFFEDWEIQNYEDDNSGRLSVSEGKQKVVVKRDHRGRFRPTK